MMVMVLHANYCTPIQFFELEIIQGEESSKVKLVADFFFLVNNLN